MRWLLSRTERGISSLAAAATVEAGPLAFLFLAVEGTDDRGPGEPTLT